MDFSSDATVLTVKAAYQMDTESTIFKNMCKCLCHNHLEGKPSSLTLIGPVCSVDRQGKHERAGMVISGCL